MISQFLVISPRGDTVISRDYRRDIPSSYLDRYLQVLGECAYSLPPVLTDSGITSFSMRRASMVFLVTTREKEQTRVYYQQLLSDVVDLLQQFLGVLNEESIRRNFPVVYEVLDEVFDNGIVQTLSVEAIKPRIHCECALIPSQLTGQNGAANLNTVSGASQISGGKNMMSSRSSSAGRPLAPISREVQPGGILATSAATVLGSNIARSMVDTASVILQQNNLTALGDSLASLAGVGRSRSTEDDALTRSEIFVDVIEQLSTVIDYAGGENSKNASQRGSLSQRGSFSSSGDVRYSLLTGSISLRSFLGCSPTVKLCLSENLVVQTLSQGNSWNYTKQNPLVLSDASFGAEVDLSEFEAEKVLTLVCPEGETTVMNYRIDGGLSADECVPVSLTAATFELADGGRKLNVCLSLRGSMASSQHVTNCCVKVQVPLPVASASFDYFPANYRSTPSPAMSSASGMSNGNSGNVWAGSSHTGGNSRFPGMGSEYDPSSGDITSANALAGLGNVVSNTIKLGQSLAAAGIGPATVAPPLHSAELLNPYMGGLVTMVGGHASSSVENIFSLDTRIDGNTSSTQSASVLASSCDATGITLTGGSHSTLPTLEWKVAKINSGDEYTLKASLVLARPIDMSAISSESKVISLGGATAYSSVAKVSGPLLGIHSIPIEFEVPCAALSRMQIRFLRIPFERPGISKALRWVRYLTHTRLYEYRL